MYDGPNVSFSAFAPGRTKVFKFLNLSMIALLLLAAVLQYNDPDPVRWVALYGTAAAMAGMIAAGWRVPAIALIGLGAIALFVGLRIALGVYGLVSVHEMFESASMKNDRVELAREAGGLLITATWMMVLALRSRADRHSARTSSP